MKRRYRSGKVILFLPLFLAGFALFIWLVMLLWNGVLTQATGVRIINFWQAAGILVLSKILFGFGGGWKGHRRSQMRERFANMTPEEKEQFKANWKERCNRWGRRNDPPASFAE